jgi:prepilin-type N-terminal cleavage/methylation domain-containing protein
MTHTHRNDHDAERGTSLIELMIALVVLALGILAVGQLFPAGSRSQLQDRMMSSGSNYAQEQLETLRGLSWSDAALSVGRHPAGTATEALGPTGQWHRYYEVSQLASPLDNLKKVAVTVNWTFMGARKATAVTYLRR